MKRLVAVYLCWFVLTFSSFASAQVKLELKQEEGTTLTQTTLNLNQILSIMGMDVKTAVKALFKNSSAYGKRGADGKQRVKEKIESLKVDLDLPGGIKLSYDSDKPDTKYDNPMVQAIYDIYRAVKGATFTLITGADHRVVAVEGLDQIISNAPSAATNELRKHFNESRLKREHDQEVAMLPDKPVKKGDRWRRDEEMYIGSGQFLKFVNYYEYVGTVEKNGKTLDKMIVYSESVNYTIEEGSAIPVTVKKSELTIASTTGEVLFDRTLGLVVERSSATRITGQLTLAANNMEFPATLDVTLNRAIVTMPRK